MIYDDYNGFSLFFNEYDKYVNVIFSNIYFIVYERYSIFYGMPHNNVIISIYIINADFIHFSHSKFYDILFK